VSGLFNGQKDLYSLRIIEMLTEEILEGWKKGIIDARLLVTNIHNKSIQIDSLFYEEFIANVASFVLLNLVVKPLRMIRIRR
jgi:hypothetical protein